MADPDKLDPVFLKLVADLIAEPLTHILNLSRTVWKSAFILPLAKGDEPSNVNNSRPISKLCILAKVFEKIVSKFQSGFRKQHSSTVTYHFKPSRFEMISLKQLIARNSVQPYCSICQRRSIRLTTGY